MKVGSFDELCGLIRKIAGATALPLHEEATALPLRHLCCCDGEFFREPDAPLTGMFTRGQFLSLFLVLMGVGFLIAAKARPTWAPKFR